MIFLDADLAVRAFEAPTAIAVPHAVRCAGDSKLRPALPIRVLDKGDVEGR
jgi:hypothetical protein